MSMGTHQTDTDHETLRGARALLHGWEAAVNSGDSEAALACYADDAVLHPTYRPGWNQGRENIASYFAMLGSRPGVGVSFDHCELRCLAPGVAVADGHYAFRWLDGDDRISDEARFTYVLRETSEGWRIVSHHSSSMPGR